MAAQKPSEVRKDNEEQNIPTNERDQEEPPGLFPEENSMGSCYPPQTGSFGKTTQEPPSPPVSPDPEDSDFPLTRVQADIRIEDIQRETPYQFNEQKQEIKDQGDSSTSMAKKSDIELDETAEQSLQDALRGRPKISLEESEKSKDAGKEKKPAKELKDCLKVVVSLMLELSSRDQDVTSVCFFINKHLLFQKFYDQWQVYWHGALDGGPMIENHKKMVEDCLLPSLGKLASFVPGYDQPTVQVGKTQESLKSTFVKYCRKILHNHLDELFRDLGDPIKAKERQKRNHINTNVRNTECIKFGLEYMMEKIKKLIPKAVGEDPFRTTKKTIFLELTGRYKEVMTNLPKPKPRKINKPKDGKKPKNRKKIKKDYTNSPEEFSKDSIGLLFGSKIECDQGDLKAGALNVVVMSEALLLYFTDLAIIEQAMKSLIMKTLYGNPDKYLPDYGHLPKEDKKGDRTRPFVESALEIFLRFFTHLLDAAQTKNPGQAVEDLRQVVVYLRERLFSAKLENMMLWASESEYFYRGIRYLDDSLLGYSPGSTPQLRSPFESQFKDLFTEIRDLKRMSIYRDHYNFKELCKGVMETFRKFNYNGSGDPDQKSHLNKRAPEHRGEVNLLQQTELDHSEHFGASLQDLLQPNQNGSDESQSENSDAWFEWLSRKD